METQKSNAIVKASRHAYMKQWRIMNQEKQKAIQHRYNTKESVREKARQKRMLHLEVFQKREHAHYLKTKALAKEIQSVSLFLS